MLKKKKLDTEEQKANNNFKTSLEQKLSILKAPFMIEFSDNDEIVYKMDGRILRLEKATKDEDIQNIYFNLEQVNKLTWNGQYGLGNHKIGMWNILWNGELLNFGGKYDEQGLKIGRWVEISEHYKTDSVLTLSGNYEKGKKLGNWDICLADKKLGGGQYDDQNNKCGRWTELHNHFDKNFYIILIGIYENNYKKGEWNAYLKQGEGKQMKNIGVGNYGENGVKIGKWIELDESFSKKNQVIYNGQYANGSKMGKWDISFRENVEDEFQIIGGGSYLNNVKNGLWTVLHKNYNKYCQVIDSGEIIDGKKIGHWEMKYRETAADKFEKIGDGVYDKEGQKMGKWTVIFSKFEIDCQIKYQGEYKNGKKIGKWEIYFRENYDEDFKSLGMGEYNLNGIKIGKWVQLFDNFNTDCQVKYVGEYQNNKKYGHWDIIFNYEKNQRIGGGSFDENGIKIGKWIELPSEFNNDYQIKQIGTYQKGLRINKWEIYFRPEPKGGFKKIGECNYGNNCVKVGKWTELHEKFDSESQTIMVGQYSNGIKFGNWNYKFRDDSSHDFYKKGGGEFDENGMKIGDWVELCENYSVDCQVTFDGEYKNGKRIGYWNFEHDYDGERSIGGGDYDEQGVKIGEWQEVDNTFYNFSQLRYSGVYKNGKKVGIWNTQFRVNHWDKFKDIGGGQYDAEEQKIGIWIDMIEDYSKQYYEFIALQSECKIIEKGQYEFGNKIGKWELILMDKDETIGWGCFDKDGIKIDSWIEFLMDCEKQNIALFQGKYQNGRKFGRWDILYISWNKKEMLSKIIGGGNYDQNGLKSGFWIELDEEFSSSYQCISTGNYIEGIRQGIFEAKLLDQ